MIELTLVRTFFSARATEGRLWLDGVDRWATLEDRTRGLRIDMTPGQIAARKIYGETAIPTGRCRVLLTESARARQGTLWTPDQQHRLLQIITRGFEGIRIHAANSAEQLLGCVAVGVDATGPDDDLIGGSRVALTALMAAVVPRMDAGEECWVTLIEAPDPVHASIYAELSA